MGFGFQRAAFMAKEKKRSKSTKQSSTSPIPYPTASVLTNENLLVHVFSFLPMREIPTYRHVSKAFNHAFQNEMPLKLRIEDRGKNLLWIFRPSWKLDKDGQSDRDEMVCPFYKIGFIPPYVRKRVTELTLVMRLVEEHLDEYQLESMIDILQDFTNLEYLRVMSNLGPGDAFCSLFQHKNYFPHLRTVFVSGYCLDFLAEEYVAHSEESEKKRWEVQVQDYNVRTRGSSLPHLVQTAPNIEYLEICTRAQGSTLEHLLPLAKSLRAVRICTLPGFPGDIDNFVKHMPLLQSWDFRAPFCGFLTYLPENRAKNLDALSTLDASVYVKHHGWYMACTDWDWTLAHIYFFKCYVSWFCNLKDEDKNRCELTSLLSVAKAFSLDQMTKGGMGLENIGSRLVKKNVENGFKSFRRYFFRRDFKRFHSLMSLCWRISYTYQRIKLCKIQECCSRKHFGIWKGVIGLETLWIAAPHYFYYNDRFDEWIRE